MLKKIVLFIILFSLTNGCDYSPIHSNKVNNIQIEIIDITGDNEINNYMTKELKRKSKNSSEKVKVKINTNFSKRILAKDTKSFATDYELNVIGNFELKKGTKSQSFTISEKFRYKNLNDNYEQRNYEAMLKRNLAKIIVSKLSLRINNFK
tara:strand:- start:833 stop:1285 length:453 start_codon:yes stop_codon:yes gene_type:complete